MMKCDKYFSLLVIALLSSCSGFAVPIPTASSIPSPSARSSPVLTLEPTYTPTSDPKEALLQYGLFAYTADVDGSEDIFTMRADGSNQTNITNHPARDIDPAWSPDGQKMAFVSLRNGNAHIFVMNSDGSDTIQLTNGTGTEYDFSWSPDGQKIAYVSYSNEPNVSHAQLIIMNSDGSNKTVLTNKLFSGYEVLGWSPDSQYLVYRIWEEEKSPGLYAVNVNRSDQFVWADLSYMDHIHWLDNKNFIAYSRFWWDKGKKQWLIQKLGIDGSRTEFHVSDMNIATVFDKTYVTESQDGLNWFTFEGNLISSSPFSQRCEKSRWDAYFSFSPDKQLAFVTAFCWNTSFFYLVNHDGTIVQSIGETSYDYGQTTRAGWSRDGKYVARVIWHSINYIPHEDIYLFEIQKTLNDPSTPPIRLTTDGATKSWGPLWQPMP